METRSDGFLQIEDEKGFQIESAEPFKFKCCDCGLVHTIVLVSEDGKPIGVAMRQEKDTVKK